MDVSAARDVVIIILGCLYIILTIGIIAGLIIIFLKVKRLLNFINNILRPVYRWMGYFRNMAKALNFFTHVSKQARG